jgi:hypothetical protein
MNLQLYELKNIMMEMSELGAANYAKQIKPVADQISEREAFRRFGETKIRVLVKMKLIHWERNGTASRSKKLYSIAEILTALKAEGLRSVINSGLKGN